MRSSTTDRPALGRDFRRLWVAQGASLTGAQVTEIALPLLAVVTLHASAGEVGAIGVARWLPYVLLALPLGVLVDRRRRRTLLIGSDLARLALTCALVAAAASGVLTTAGLLALVFAIGTFAVVFEVAYQSFLPAVAQREHLATANSRLQATDAVTQLAGPGLGGALVQLLTAPFALLAHGLCYALSALALGRIATAEAPVRRRRGGYVADLRDGLRYVRRDGYLIWLAGCSGLYNLFEQAVMVLFALYAVRELGLSPGVIGLVLALGALGAVAGAAATGSVVRRHGAGRVMLTCAAVESVALFAVPLAGTSWSTPATVAFLAGGFALNGAGTASSSIVSLTLRQLRTTDAVLGRVNAIMRSLSYGSIAVGAALGGVLGSTVGLRPALLVGCAGLLSTVAWVAVSPLARVGDPAAIGLAPDA